MSYIKETKTINVIEFLKKEFFTFNDRIFYRENNNICKITELNITSNEERIVTILIPIEHFKKMMTEFDEQSLVVKKILND